MMSTSENIASTMRSGSDGKTADDLVYLWKKSPDHEYSMRIPEWTHTGVGAVVGEDGRVYATQIFTSKNYSEIPDHTRFHEF